MIFFSSQDRPDRTGVSNSGQGGHGEAATHAVGADEGQRQQLANVQGKINQLPAIQGRVEGLQAGLPCVSEQELGCKAIEGNMFERRCSEDDRPLEDLFKVWEKYMVEALKSILEFQSYRV
jgi:hypothetical protein